MRYPFNLYGQLPGLRVENYTAKNIENVSRFAKIAEDIGYKGVLLFYNHYTVDPWILAASILENTSQLVPLIAVQPYALPPFSVANMVKSFAFLYNRRINLNMIIGATPQELNHVQEDMIHDERYERLKEYVEVIKHILSVKGPISYDGKFYHLNNFESSSSLSDQFYPKIFMAGSSEKGIDCAMQIADVAITHPGPIIDFRKNFMEKINKINIGIRIGIIARRNKTEAWNVANILYPNTRKGTLITKFKMSSQNEWSRKLASLSVNGLIYDNVYWLGGLHSRELSYPILVGDYESVASYLSKYLEFGVKEIILGGHIEEEEIIHNKKVFDFLA